MSYVHYNRQLVSDSATRLLAAERRARLVAAGHCINGPSHIGPLMGRKCPECVAQHDRYDLLPSGCRAHLKAMRLERELKRISAA